MSSFLVSSKNASLSSLLWLRREHTWTLNWKEVCFQNCLDLPFPTVRVGIGWSTLCNSLALSPHVRDSQEDKSILVYFKKVFLIRSVWPVTEYTRANIWKKSLLIGFESHHGMVFTISHTPEQIEDGEHFADG